MARTKTRRLNLGQQVSRLTGEHQNFSCKKSKKHRNRFICEGRIRPTPLSEEYRVQVILEQGQHPEIRVLEPQLKLAPGAKRLPHIYPGKSLCLYTRSKQEWDSGKYVADTVIPWISSYLFYYEIWLATGEWFGDGTEPE